MNHPVKNSISKSMTYNICVRKSIYYTSANLHWKTEKNWKNYTELGGVVARLVFYTPPRGGG